MNVSLSNLRVQALALPYVEEAQKPVAISDFDHGRIRRLRSLISLFALYGAALLTVIVLSSGADIGCILVGISGHVLYASAKMELEWREAAWLEDARVRVARARFIRRA